MEHHADGTRLYQVVSGDCLGHHTCMFPHGEGSHIYFELRSFHQWADKFVGFEQFANPLGDFGVPWDGDDDDDES